MATVLLADARGLKYCLKGVRAFCTRHEIDFKAFVKCGVDESVLLNINDAMAHALVDAARKRESN